MLKTSFIFCCRKTLVTLGLMLVMLVPAQSLASTVSARANSGRDYFPIPQAAFVQPLGQIPASSGKYAAGRGISLGGIGAGSFMYNQAGTFGPWDFRNPIHEERILTQAAFHIYERPLEGSAKVTTLATPHPLGSVLPAWHMLSPGAGSYAALYPFGWTTYNPFASDISMRFWSPIIAQEDERSSMPVAYFDVRIANHTSSADTLSVMFTFPNAPACLQASCTRTGFYSNEAYDSTTGVTGVTLGASDPTNALDMQNTEWTIATLPQAGQTVSYTTSWNANGDGSDIYRQFSANGALNDGALDTSNSAGAIAVSTTLQPGQVTTIPFALSWDFPMTLFGTPPGAYTLWMKRYTSYFGAQETPTNDYIPGSYPFHQGFNIADTSLSGETSALNAVTTWWGAIANNPAYPLWLRQAALNELYYDNFGSTFWESGLVTNTITPSNTGLRIGSQIPGTHLFYNAEATIYPFAESYDVRAYENRQWLLLFPDIERDVQRAWTQFILDTPNGQVPHDAGLDTVSPYIVWPGDTHNKPANWLDLSAKYLYQVWDYIYFTGDSQFLRYAYPAMLKAYNFLASHVPSGQYLPLENGIDSTYDAWPFDGNSSYNGGLYVLSEEIMLVATEQGITQGIPGASQTLVNQLNTDIPLSQAQFEINLWNPTQGYYQISTQDTEYGTGIMADAMFAQHIAETLSLPDIVGNPDHLHTHLLNSYNYLVAPWHDAQGNLMGAATGVNANKTIIKTAGYQAKEMWAGVTYFYAATQYQDGVRFGDTKLEQNALNTAYGAAYQTYSVPQNGYYFETPEAWHILNAQHGRALQYMRPRAIWELVLAIQQPFAWSNSSHTYSSLSAAVNNPGISDDSDLTAANFDGNGYSYSAEALATAGLSPGGTFEHKGVMFTWPNETLGTPDDVLAAGQTIVISGTGTKLAFIGASSFGPLTARGVITYSDGSTQSFSLVFSDWTLNKNTKKLSPRDAIIATMPYENHPTDMKSFPAYVFYTSVGLAPGKQIQSVTLPLITETGSGNNFKSLHIFAIGVG